MPGSMKEAVRLVLVRELEAFCREVEAFPDDERLWQTLPGITNACGNLARHVAGNLQHFVGARLGGTGYVRHREAEFSQRSVRGRRWSTNCDVRATSWTPRCCGCPMRAGRRSIQTRSRAPGFPRACSWCISRRTCRFISARRATCDAGSPATPRASNRWPSPSSLGCWSAGVGPDGRRSPPWRWRRG